jgi:hypothetical protein
MDSFLFISFSLRGTNAHVEEPIFPLVRIAAVCTPTVKRSSQLLSTRKSATSHTIATIVAEVAVSVAYGDASAVIATRGITLEPGELIRRSA